MLPFGIDAGRVRGVRPAYPSHGRHCCGLWWIALGEGVSCFLFCRLCRPLLFLLNLLHLNGSHPSIIFVFMVMVFRFVISCFRPIEQNDASSSALMWIGLVRSKGWLCRAGKSGGFLVPSLLIILYVVRYF